MYVEKGFKVLRHGIQSSSSACTIHWLRGGSPAVDMRKFFVKVLRMRSQSPWRSKVQTHAGPGGRLEVRQLRCDLRLEVL